MGSKRSVPRSRTVLTVVLAAAAYAATLPAGGVTMLPETKLDSGEGGAFGHAVALSDDTLVVGAPEAELFAGAAYVYARKGGAWAFVAKLTASDGLRLDRFGHSVDVHGETIVVGAPGDDDLGDGSGSAYVFVRKNGAWLEATKLLASDGAVGDAFGSSVAFDGDRIAVGADSDDDFGKLSGAVYVFGGSRSTWTELTQIQPDDASAYARFGRSVSLSADRLLVGAPHEWRGGAAELGSAYVFSAVDWLPEAKLTAFAWDAQVADQFGASVALGGTHAVVGAPGNDVRAADSGSAYFFRETSNGWSGGFYAPLDGGPGDRFGASVALDGGIAVVGAPGHGGRDHGAGAAYVYAHHFGGWRQVAKLTPYDGDGGDSFGGVDGAGAGVAVAEGTAVAGASGKPAAYAFAGVDEIGAEWLQDDAGTGGDASDDPHDPTHVTFGEGGGAFKGSAYPVLDDLDAYGITMPSGAEELCVDIGPPAVLDVKLELRRPDGSLADFSDRGGLGGDETVCAPEPPAEGTWTLVLRVATPPKHGLLQPQAEDGLLDLQTLARGGNYEGHAKCRPRC